MKAPRLGSEEVSYSDRISHLPDDLLFRILSFIPARHAISTSLLSKRWKFVWKMMPTLDLDEYSFPYVGSHRFDKFCRMYLKSHEAQVLKSLDLKLKTHLNGIDSMLSNIQSILLEITINSNSDSHSPIRFSRSLHVYQTLIVMKLQNSVVVDVSTPVCFQSLKCLHLNKVKYSCRESFTTLLSACPVLEDLNLFVKRDHFNCLDSFTISVPSLQRLSICEGTLNRSTMFEINTPSLKYLEISGRLYCFKFVEDMPMLAEAHIEAYDYEYKNKKLMRFLTSVERLSISIHSFSRMGMQVLELTDSIFHRVLHLELYLHNGLQGNLILSFLKSSPNLKALKLNMKPSKYLNDQQTPVSKPDTVPVCLTFHLETLEWRGYVGGSEDKEIAEYILGNARCLNMAMISRFFPSDHSCHRNGLKKDRRIVKELKSIYKASTSCQLVLQRQHNP